MQDREEQQAIRDAYREHPGMGHLVEQYAGEWENAVARGDDYSAVRAGDLVRHLGWDTAEGRKADAERRAREAERIKANRGDDAVDYDREKGSEAAQKSADVPGSLSRAEAAQRQPPSGRVTPRRRLHKTTTTGDAGKDEG